MDADDDLDSGREPVGEAMLRESTQRAVALNDRLQVLDRVARAARAITPLASGDILRRIWQEQYGTQGMARMDALMAALHELDSIDPQPTAAPVEPRP